MNRAPPADSLPLDVVLRCSHSEGDGAGAVVIHGRLLRLAQLRERYQETLGKLAVLFQSVDGWRRIGFASFDEYCEERLGMDPREVEQLAAQARRDLRRSRNAKERPEE